jgi:hypothetical protein
MAEIIIKKKVSLEFLGDDYKDSFITFRSIPIGEYQELVEKIDEVEDNKSLSEIMKILEKYFVEGLFDGQKLAKEDINQFDGETVLKCFETLTGQKTVEGERQLDPLSESESTNTSTTEADTVQK